VLAAIVVATMGCGSGSSPPPAKAPAREKTKPEPRLRPAGDAPFFRFRAIDGREISSDVARGRNTVLAFLATFDWASQAQARFLAGIERHHRPRTNCYAIVLERPENQMLVESFVATLSLRYPVAHVPAEQLAETDLREVRAVPSVLVLDTGGNLVWKSQGLATEDAIDLVLEAVEKGTPE